MQKVNRFIEPHLTGLRCKAFKEASKICVVVYIPASLPLTHVVAKDGAFKQPSGVSKVVLRQGTLYVRRSGANNLANARDIDAIVARRIEHYRASLMDKISRVVESPPDTEVLIVTPKGEAGADKKFVIENSSDAIAVKGLSFTVSPETTEQEIAAWIAITTKAPADLPSPGTVWKWYRERCHLELTKSQKVWVAAFSLLRGAPLFYWLQDCPSADIREMLLAVLDRTNDPNIAGNVILAASFVGKAFHKSAVAKLGAMAKRLNKRDLEYPMEGPRSLVEGGFPRDAKPKSIELQLDKLAATSLTTADGQPELKDRWRAEKLDAYLYAPVRLYD